MSYLKNIKDLNNNELMYIDNTFDKNINDYKDIQSKLFKHIPYEFIFFNTENCKFYIYLSDVLDKYDMFDYIASIVSSEPVEHIERTEIDNKLYLEITYTNYNDN